MFGKPTETATTATATPAPENIPVPEEAIIRQPVDVPPDPLPAVTGDKRIAILDTESKTVEVVILEGKHINPEISGKLVFVQGAVSNELLPEAQARNRFALSVDGTVKYNSRGWDGGCDMVDIVKLVESNAKG